MAEHGITGFKALGRRAARIEVYVAGELWATLDAETVVREGLRKGMRLTATRAAAILAADEAIRARKAAAGCAARSPKTERELKIYLARRGFSEPAASAALAVLRESGTVDDLQAAGRVIRARRRRADMGPVRIEAELRARGIDSETAERLVDGALAGHDLAAECLEVARRAQGRYRPLAEDRQRAKLMQYLLRRGYETEAARAAVDHLRAQERAAAE